MTLNAKELKKLIHEGMLPSDIRRCYHNRMDEEARLWLKDFEATREDLDRLVLLERIAQIDKAIPEDLFGQDLEVNPHPNLEKKVEPKKTAIPAQSTNQVHEVEEKSRQDFKPILFLGRFLGAAAVLILALLSLFWFVQRDPTMRGSKKLSGLNFHLKPSEIHFCALEAGETAVVRLNVQKGYEYQIHFEIFRGRLRVDLEQPDGSLFSSLEVDKSQVLDILPEQGGLHTLFIKGETTARFNLMLSNPDSN